MKTYRLGFIPPTYAQSSPAAFDDPDGIFESKLDGYRAIAVIDGVGEVRLWSRNGLSFDSRYPLIRDELKVLKLRSTDFCRNYRYDKPGFNSFFQLLIIFVFILEILSVKDKRAWKDG